MAFLTDAEKKDAGSAHLDHVEVEDVDQTRRSRLAAEHAEFEKNLTFWKSVKLYWRSCLWSLYTLILIFNFGIDNIISGLLTTMPKFRADYGEPIEVAPGFFDYTIPARWLSAFSAAAQGAAIIGGFIGGYLSDRFGRKITIAVSCVIAIGGIAAQYFSNGSLPVLVVGKGILGLPFGMWIVLATTYISETAPFQVRGVLSSMVNATIMAGVLLFSGVITVLGVRIDASAYKIPFAIQWALPSLILITIIFLPESPVWLCRMGRREKAISALRKLHGSCEDTRQEGILALIEETLKNEAESCGQQVEYRFGYRDCFNKSNRGRTIATMWVYASQYLSAAVLVIGWQSYFYIFTFGWSAEKAFNVYLGSTGVLFAANVIGWYLITRMKRRFILIWGQLIAAACLFVIGGCSTAGTNEGAIAAAAFMYIWVSG
jgi:MFS family permease